MCLIKLTFFCFQRAHYPDELVLHHLSVPRGTKKGCHLLTTDKKGAITTILIITITDVYESLCSERGQQSVPANEGYKSC